MQVTIENQKCIDTTINNQAVQTVYLVKDLIDLKTNAYTQTNSNEHPKVSENGSKEEKEKVVEKESGKEAKGAKLEK